MPNETNKSSFTLSEEDLFTLKESSFLASQALTAFRENRFKDSIKLLELAVERYPEYTRIFELLAIMYEKDHHPNKAIWVWESLVEREPDNIGYLMKTAILCDEREWYGKSEKYFLKVLEYDPANADAWELLTGSYFAQIEHKKALNTCINAIATLKEHGIVSVPLYVDAFILSDLEGDESAIDYLRELVKLIKSDETRSAAKYEEKIDALLDYANMLDYSNKFHDETILDFVQAPEDTNMLASGEIISLIREIVDMVPGLSKRNVAFIRVLELRNEITKLGDNYTYLIPELLSYTLNLDIHEAEDEHSEDDENDEYLDEFDELDDLDDLDDLNELHELNKFIDLDDYDEFDDEYDDEYDYDDDYEGDPDLDDDLNTIMSMECSILNDIEGYRPHIERLAKDHPSLYALCAPFFDEALTVQDPTSMLKERIDTLAEKDLSPKLMHADGRELRKEEEAAIYSRYDDETGKNIPYRREGPKIGRNDPCPCGSGKKYKKCHGA